MAYTLHFTAIQGEQPKVPENVISKSESKKEVSDKKEEKAEEGIKNDLDVDMPDHSDIVQAFIQPAAFEQKYSLFEKKPKQIKCVGASGSGLALTKELDAYYHIFIDRIAKIESQVKRFQLSKSVIMGLLAETSIERENILDLFRDHHKVLSAGVSGERKKGATKVSDKHPVKQNKSVSSGE